jgi:hypothetical protein
MAAMEGSTQGHYLDFSTEKYFFANRLPAVLMPERVMDAGSPDEPLRSVESPYVPHPKLQTAACRH